MTSFAGCGKDITVPQHLIGEWKTSAPKYEDRYLKITKDSLIFGVGNGNENAHNIRKIKVKKENQQEFYTIHYRDAEGGKWTQKFTYNPDSGRSITLENRSEIWKKAGP